jgi:phosphoglycolate phosphatase
MLLAAQKLSLAPAACWYLGDDLRDVQAARAAGMRPAAVEWGYISPDNGAPHAWNADAVLRDPLDLLRLL